MTSDLRIAGALFILSQHGHRPESATALTLPKPTKHRQSDCLEESEPCPDFDLIGQHLPLPLSPSARVFRMKILINCSLPFALAHGGQQSQIERTQTAL
jgi:hypothetical protein